MPADKKSAKPAAKAPAAAGSKKPKKVQPRFVRKLLAHRVTRPLWSKIRVAAKKKKADPVSLIRKKPKVVEKPVGGDKNGGKRLVHRKKPRKYYPTEDRLRRSKAGHVCYKNHARKLKAGIEPGRVVIILAGRHKGKRVIVLKALPSGLMLVTGPHVINGCPLRRMHQKLVIVTSTKLEIGNIKLPANLNDAYFKRPPTDPKKKSSKKADGGDIFSQKAESYKPNEQRKKDQIEVDKQIVDVIKKNKDKKLLLAYLGSYFQLRNHMFPHKLKF